MSADEIREFVNRNYFEPARARGESQVVITSGQVHRDMNLSSRMPSVCGVLRGQYLRVFNVILIKEIKKEGVVLNSSTNQFIFTLNGGRSDNSQTYSKSESKQSPKRNYYEVLGINKSTREDQIRDIYKKLARIYHWDVGQHIGVDGEKPFREIKEAYETLVDPVKRASYDRYLAK